MSNDYLWVEKYRPTTIEECILPDNLKKTFQEFVNSGEIPNLLLAGPPGIGKTTVAKALCQELGVDCYVINGSDEGRFLDTVRNQAKNFASTVSLTSESNHKVIIIDEADNTTHDVQLLLRANIEAFYNNCRFIFTCNYKNKIIEPLHSRCAVVDFGITGKEKPKIAALFFKRLQTILKNEGVECDPNILAELINKHFPDWRRVLNELQRHRSDGVIHTPVLSELTNVNTSELVKFIAKKEFPNVRKWIVQNLDNDPNTILRGVYNAIYDSMKPKSIPEAVLIIAKYQYQSAFAADHEINLLAAMTEIMVNCEFKS